MASSFSEAMADTSLQKRELLLLEDIPVVITPAKVAQPILESPSTITVLTKEDMRRYGITSFADILRNIPGVDVMSVSPTDRNISIRGPNGLAAGRVLSLLNNIPIQVDFFGITMWESLPISLDEIERIEIIRGPGSALYGANAFDGVVNIITDSPLATTGANVTAVMDQHGRMRSSIVDGGGIGNLNYRASAGWYQQSGWDDADIDAGENRSFGGCLSYAINDNSAIHLSGNIQQIMGDLAIIPSFGSVEYDTTESDLEMNYSISDLRCYVFRSTTSSVGDISDGVPYHFENNSFGAELQHSFHPIKSNFITWGLEHIRCYT
jgi:outer membrane cobalamin receptor